MPKKIQIDLNGPDGNAYNLGSIAKGFCEQLDWEWKPIWDEMTSGNYENLLKVFEKKFGSIVKLVR